MKRLPYGETGLPMPAILSSDRCKCDIFTLPDSTMNAFSNRAMEKQRIINALYCPTSRPQIEDWIKKGDKAVIIVPDITRKCPTSVILEILLPIIEKASPEEILIVVATGMHKAATHDELITMLGKDIVCKYKVINHCSDKDCTYIGTTSRKNRILINENVANADKIFLIGAANFHVFAGFSGGRKSILPGVSAKSAILYNHKLMVGENGLLESSNIGIKKSNPVHEDMTEAMGLLGTEKMFLINVVTNVHAEILEAYAGDPLIAFDSATKAVEAQYSLNVKKQYDIVISCASGSPSDKCFYQAGKALELAMHMPKARGDFFVVAECDEGIGENEEIYREWCGLKPDEFIHQFKNKYHNLGTGPYKINLLRQRECSLYLVSDYDPEMAEFLHMKSVKSTEFEKELEGCINGYIRRGAVPDIAIIPYGSHSALTMI